VAFEKFKRAPAWCALALVITSACFTSLAEAAGLGRLTVHSALGQPLRAEVEVTSVGRDEAGSLVVRLAAQSAFRQANLEFNPALSALRFALDKRGGDNFVVRISSAQPINEPYLDLLLELVWSTGRVLREYTVLLDPPALRTAPEVITPVTPPVAVAPAAPLPQAAPTPAPAPEPEPAPVTPPAAAAPAPEAPAQAPAPITRAPEPAAPAAAAVGESTYTVKPGDTLGKIALRNKSTTVSLDQMLVAMFRANPNAFVGNNMNRLLAGRTLTIPSAVDAESIVQGDARSEVVAQSADFARYRSRLAQAATASVPIATTPPAAAAGQGRVTTQVEDKSAPPKTGDQLKIAKAETAPTAGAAAAAKAKDEEIARQRAMKEQEERAAELKRANEQLKKALELQSKAGAQVQKQAEAKKEEPAQAAPVEPVAKVEPTPAEPPKVEASPSPAPVEPPATAETPKVEAPKPEPVKAAPPPEETSGPGILDSLTDSNSLFLVGGLVAVLALLVGLNLYRKRRVEKTEEFRATGEGLRANSLFGQTGGQSVDTGATSTFNSSFIPAASQLDSNEVDPVAEADVYIAYGREEQAEDILKEALRMQPDRHAVRVKLLEIYSRRGDRASFDAVAEELRARTGGVGEDWERAQKLGRGLDPSNPIYGTAGFEAAMRGPTTELRLNPSTVTPRPPAATPAPVFADSMGQHEEISASGPISVTAKLLPDTRMTDTAMPADSRLSDTEMPLDTTGGMSTSMPMQSKTPSFTPSFSASLPTGSESVTPKSPGTIEPFGGGSSDRIDFAALDFDLGSSNTATPGAGGPTSTPPAPPPMAFPQGFDLNLETTQPRVAAPAPAVDLTFPPTKAPVTAQSTATGRSVIPDVDLSLPPQSSAPAFAMPPAAAPAPTPAMPSFQETLSRPTLLGDVGALPEEQAPRLTSNTDQATVPLIDFDLTGSDVELGGRRTETQAGSPMAAQMATKLDLARGYIDLGVKDGARELLEEVMRDGTREQRQQAVDLLKQVEV
jgi:pilus assembly protein FimV